MQASGAGDPNGAAGDFDLVSAWTLVGRGTPNTGVLVASVEYRNAYTDQPPSALGGELGTLINVTNAFNDRGWVVRDFYWLQRLLDGKLRLLFGRADLGDFFGLQPMQNVNTMFVNRHFSGNPTMPSPGHGPTIDFSLRPNDRFYVSGGMANAYNNTQESELDSIDDGDFFYTAEVGFTPYIEGMGRGRYSITGWYINERDRDTVIPSDQGVTLVAGQQLSDRFQVWARYAYADATITNIRQLAQAGLGYTGLFGSPSNMTGFAFSFAQPRSDQSREEKVSRCFERFQVSRFTQITVGAQAIFDPGNNPDTRTCWASSTRGCAWRSDERRRSGGEPALGCLRDVLETQRPRRRARGYTTCDSPGCPKNGPCSPRSGTSRRPSCRQATNCSWASGLLNR